jgi:Rhodopirellula transposase DDE domain
VVEFWHPTGRPLETHEVVVETIAATTTTIGLTIQAALDTNTYPRGIKITDKEMKAFETAHLQRHTFHGDWNYTVTASPSQDTTRPNREK